MRPLHLVLGAALARRGMTGKELAERLGLSETLLSLFRSGKVRGIRFATLARMCSVLGCVPGELLDYEPDPADLAGEAADEV